MRMGKYWHLESIDNATLTRIHQILNGEMDESTASRIKEKYIHLDNFSSFQGLPTWLACYIVYNRHSEIKDNTKWKQPSDIDAYIQSFKQHSLHNPIVEQIIMETLRTVRDIWKQIGHIDEIHVELGREMKNPADKRKNSPCKYKKTKTPICASRHFSLSLQIRSLKSKMYVPTLPANKIYYTYMKKRS